MPGSISPWPVVGSGANGHPMKTLQYLLRARGQSVAVDETFGPQTDGAVRSFQTSRGLTADGIVGPVTWAALVVQVKKGSQRPYGCSYSGARLLYSAQFVSDL